MIDAMKVLSNLSPFGVSFKEDYHTLRGEHVQALVDEAKACGYRRPKNANGSTGRYFFEAVKRKLAKVKA